MKPETVFAITMTAFFTFLFGAMSIDKYTEHKYMEECVKTHTPADCKAGLK